MKPLTDPHERDLWHMYLLLNPGRNLTCCYAFMTSRCIMLSLVKMFIFDTRQTIGVFVVTLYTWVSTYDLINTKAHTSNNAKYWPVTSEYLTDSLPFQRFSKENAMIISIFTCSGQRIWQQKKWYIISAQRQLRFSLMLVHQWVMTSHM